MAGCACRLCTLLQFAHIPFTIFLSQAPHYVELYNITNHEPPSGSLPCLHNRQQMLANLQLLALPSHTFLALAHVCMRNKCCSLSGVKLPTIW
jgi:hypothetical protein